MSADVSTPEPIARPASLLELFMAFNWLALQGFGGVLAVAQRVLCEERRWLTREQFVELLAIGQVLPGPNVCNLAVLAGDRFFGWRGAAAALGGIVAAPLLIVLIMTALYVQFADVSAVMGALKGMAAVAAGLIVGTALRLLPTLRSNPLGPQACALLGALTLAAVALLRLPLLWVLGSIGALAVAWAWRAIRLAELQRELEDPAS
jgi:chromate transporter